MTNFPLTPVNQECAVFEDETAAEKLISGNAMTKLWNAFSDPSDQFHVGHWSSDICKMHVTYTEQELCVILEGIVCLTDEAGEETTYKKGDAFVIPSGFKGTWETIEPVTKIYAIYEQN